VNGTEALRVNNTNRSVWIGTNDFGGQNPQLGVVGLGPTNSLFAARNGNITVATIETNGPYIWGRDNSGVRAVVSGVITNTGSGNYTNLNATIGTVTNLMNYTFPTTCLLTNTGDFVYLRWGGVLRNAFVSTNEFLINVGSTVILDTGAQACSNGNWWAELRVWRNGTSDQWAEAVFNWDACAGRPFASTNGSSELSDPLSGTILRLRSAASGVGSHTNKSFFMEYVGAP
jgi:hypothetical protein